MVDKIKTYKEGQGDMLHFREAGYKVYKVYIIKKEYISSRDSGYEGYYGGYGAGVCLRVDMDRVYKREGKIYTYMDCSGGGGV